MTSGHFMQLVWDCAGWLILELNYELSASPAALASAREQLVARLG